MQDYLQKLLADTVAICYPGIPVPEIVVEKPRISEHGDAATNIALTLAKPLGKSPRSIAEELAKGISVNPDYLDAVEIAGPGFLNFRFSNEWLRNRLTDIIRHGDAYGKTNTLSGKKYLVEFVSANPTGPLTVGHGRNAVLGDTIARLYEWIGADVTREYYFNNAGRQMRVLGESVRARYLQQNGIKAALPEGGYEGEYITEIARELIAGYGHNLIDDSTTSVFRETAEKLIFDDIRRTLGRMQIKMDTFFNEDDLYKNGSIESVLNQLRESGLIYESDGAIWFKTTNFGKEKDTVLVKSTGEPTYRLPDIAYHAHKLDRGYDVCIDIFGADHIATYPDVMSGIRSLGYDDTRIDVLVYQFVTIVKDGKPFKMSTRKANFVTLDELMDEVGADVTRFFFLMRSPGTHLEFDIAQAKEAGDKNPVFYLQYAYARIQSIMRKVKEELNLNDEADLTLLTHESEIKLIKSLLDFPDTIAGAARNKEPHRIILLLNDVATDFHKFYHDCRIIGENDGLARARMKLLEAVAQVLRNGLTILGISAPDRM